MVAESGSGLVRGLQEKAARALPAEQVVRAGGWWLRHATGAAWWAGTVLPHGDAEPGELLRRITEAESFYDQRGQAARFQISPGACPEILDLLLAERGYRLASPMSLQVAATTNVVSEHVPTDLSISVDAEPSRGWFEVWHRVHGNGGAALDRLEQPTAYAGAMLGDEVVAVGRVVADDGWAGVFGMATLPHARGKGGARSVLAAMAEWASSHHADRMYLQVERDNAPALRLYERAGFTELCGYHYRTAAP